MTLLIFFFFFSIAFSFLCSVLEAVLLSVTPSFIRRQVASGGRTGKLLEEYKEDIDRPLSAILTLNTIAHTVGAIGVGAQAGKLYGANYFSLGGLNLSYESIIAGGMTLAILILSEIIPKTIGANNWQSLSGFTVRTIRVMLFILAPLVWISQLITKSLKKDKTKPVLTRSDILALTKVGESSGALLKEESQVIENLLGFEHQTVRDIMTPKTVCFMVQEDSSIADFLKIPESNTFSRIPIFGEDKDDVTGLVLKDVLLSTFIEADDPVPLKKLAREIHFVRDDMALAKLFRSFLIKKQHLFVVKDEFGSVVGLVTMEDLFETMLGLEIMDESDQVADLQELARKKAEE